MDKNEIAINRINLRTRGIPPEIARSAVDGLGQEVMQNLVEQGVVNHGQIIQLSDLNLETLSLTKVGDATELRREIAQVLTKAIAARIGRK
ncbi:MAG: hypothetical protein HC941_01185 [Microcoleus sp. SU_5_3]|nr:hypothetical protein [Microcoleus sp. SU_5_3]